MKPRTSHGEMVNYYLKMEPHLFKEAVNSQFERIREEREAAVAKAKEKDKNAATANDKSELVLYRSDRIVELEHKCLIMRPDKIFPEVV